MYAGESELSQPYRRYQGAIDPTATDQSANSNDLCQRSRSAQRALFGMTAAQWRQINHQQSGNMRGAATLEQLVGRG